MTRRLVSLGQRPVTVGTWFSLGHSTIVVVTSIVVAGTAAGVSKRFEGFGKVGGIIGSGVSAVFLMVLGAINAWILWRLWVQMRKVVNMQVEEANREGFRLEMGGQGPVMRVLKRMFRLIDRPWKMYPLGVLFGLGFDTSSEIALLGISSIQGARGTSMWLILVFPVLFTAGMCLVDTADGALMMSLYVAPMGMGGAKGEESGGVGEREETGNVLTERGSNDVDRPQTRDAELGGDAVAAPTVGEASAGNNRVKDPLTFLYYSIVLTTLTVICAIVIGVIQLLTLVLNVANPEGPFWDGVAAAGDSYEIIGGAICGSFVIVGGLSVLMYGRFKSWVERRRARLPRSEGAGGPPYRDAETHSGDGRRSGGEDGARVVEEVVEVDTKDDGKVGRGNKGVRVGEREISGEGSASRER